MKFLCVPCDTPMKLEHTKTDAGAVSLVYSCPACGYEAAMLTNPMETQVVKSLGVKIGPRGEAAGDSQCPFTGIVQGMDTPATGESDAMPWTAEAEARLSAVPEFVRSMVRSGIEKFAREQGQRKVDETVLEAARALFGMGEGG